MRSILRPLAVAAVLVAGAGVLAAGPVGADEATDRWPTYGPTFTLNPGGGITGIDGMRVMFGGTQLQVQRRNGTGEIFNRRALPGTATAANLFTQIGLAVGDPTDGGTAFVAPPLVWTTRRAGNVTVLPWTVAASASDTQIVSVLTGVVDGRTYTVTVTLSYTSPDDRMKFEYVVVVPAGNTKPVRLYHVVDSYLGGWDEGPGFFTDPVTCGTGGRSGAVVGVDRADLGVVEAFQYVSGTMWAGYASAYYGDVVFGNSRKTEPVVDGVRPQFGPGFMNDFDEQIITDPRNDNGFGVDWNFGSAPGTYNTANKLIFTSDTVSPCADPEAVSPTNPDPSVIPDPVIDPEVEPDPVVDELKDPVPETPAVGPKYTG